MQVVTSSDAGAGGGELRAHILRSDIFRGVVIAAPDRSPAPWPLGPADQLALSAGQPCCARAARAAPHVPAARRARGGRSGDRVLRTESGLALAGTRPDCVDCRRIRRAAMEAARCCARTMNCLPTCVAMFARERSQRDRGPSSSWHCAPGALRQREWRGAVVAVLPEEVHLSAGRWTVIASAPLHRGWDDWMQARRRAAGADAAGGVPDPRHLRAAARRWEPVLEGSARRARRTGRRTLPARAAGRSARRAARDRGGIQSHHRRARRQNARAGEPQRNRPDAARIGGARIVPRSAARSHLQDHRLRCGDARVARSAMPPTMAACT